MADSMASKDKDQQQPAAVSSKSEFAKRNPMLERLVPDCMETAVDKILPDKLEKVLDRGLEATYNKYQNMRTELADGVGEVAGVLWRVAKYAYEKFHFHDLVFGVYQLALHHSTVNAIDDVAGEEVHDAQLIEHLIWATEAANAAYQPTKAELCKAAGVSESDVLLFEPNTTTARPAYAVWVDKAHKRVVFGFRGTTDLNDMLTDACASCEPYCGGYAHWGMHEAAQWFVQHELSKVVAWAKERDYELLLVGHSLGAGTAAMLAHMMKNEPDAKAAAAGIKFSAVGVATPAVLTEELADGCSDYVTSVVLMHDVVPRFSIHNVFSLKDEMDATNWGDILIATAKDWAVPDVIEHSETYKKLSAETAKQMSRVGSLAANAYLKLQSGIVSTLHFAGLVKPNKARQAAQPSASVGEAAAATAQTARVALHDPEVLKNAVESVGEKLAGVAQSDVHKVVAPGTLYFIKRTSDKHKGRAAYGNGVHRCALCEDDSALPLANHLHAHDAAAADDGAYPPSEPAREYSLIAAAPKQRFQRIVLRDTCLVDHLTGGYLEGLKDALSKAQAKQRMQ